MIFAPFFSNRSDIGLAAYPNIRTKKGRTLTLLIFSSVKRVSKAAALTPLSHSVGMVLIQFRTREWRYSC